MVEEPKPEELPKKSGLFAKKQPLPPLAPRVTTEVASLASRTRIVEQRISELNKKFLFIEQNMISNNKTAMNHIRSLQDELTEVKNHIHDVNDKILAVVKELKLTASKQDFGVIKKYIELWDPVKFITHDQVEKIVEEKLSEHPKSETIVIEPEES